MRYFWIALGLAYFLGVPACVIATSPKADAAAQEGRSDGPASTVPPPAAAAPAAAAASATGKILVRDALQLAAALRQLDGHMIVIKQGAQDNTVMVPWEFGSGSLRLRIANDLKIVSEVEAAAETSRQGIVKEILRKSGRDKIEGGTAEYEDFQRQYADLVAQPAAGTQDLSRLKASELKLDRNELPVTVLLGLKPVLDIDVDIGK